MRQPIIDPDKVNSWTESMRQAFGPSDLGLWLVIGFSLAFLLLVVLTAWSVDREAKGRAPTPATAPLLVHYSQVGRGARTQPRRNEQARAQRRRASFTHR